MAFTLALLMGWTSLSLIATQQENLAMAALEKQSVIRYWQSARYHECTKLESDISTCSYLKVVP